MIMIIMLCIVRSAGAAGCPPPRLRPTWAAHTPNLPTNITPTNIA